jgi:TonB family protein
MRAPAVRIAIFALALLAPGIAKADQAQIESALQSEYENKVVLLRGFYTNPALRFDANGKPVGKADPGYWSSDGMLQIGEVSLVQGVLHIGGKRIANAFDAKAGRFRNVATRYPVQIEVELDPAWQDAAPVQELLGKIFPGDLKDLLDALPDYWRWCVGDGIHRDKTGGWACHTLNPDGPFATPKLPEAGGIELYRVYRVGGGVNPPRVVTSPDPGSTKMATSLHYEGTSTLWVVVDEHGAATQIQIVRPIGVGLDDKAVEAVRTWRFQPATLNGHPVAVQIDIEVNFR